MRPLLYWMALSVVLFAVPLCAADKNAKPAAGKVKPPRERLISLGTLAGTVQGKVSDKGILTVRATFHYLEPNVPAQRAYVLRVRQLLVRQQLILANPNPILAQRQLLQLARDAENLMRSQKDLFHVKSVEKNVELELAEDVKIRTVQPLEQFDDKGNIKIYTRKELKALKGDRKLPGFQAQVSDLQRGQSIVVRVMRRKRPRGTALPVEKVQKVADNGSKSSVPDTIRLVTPDHSIFISLVMIAGDPMK